jgi:general secretion pathway protein A
VKRSAQQSLPAQALPPTAEATAKAVGPFPYRDYIAAKDGLSAALRGSAFYALVTGPSGTGKTSLARDVSAGLDRRAHQFLYLSSPKVSLLSIVRYFAQVLRVTPKRSSLETIKVIADQLQAQPTQLVAWIDEAAAVPADTMSELRTLAEFNHEVPQIFTIILSGPPELKSLLDLPALFPLKRRISVRCPLGGLRQDELEPFLVHRFGAGDARRIPLGLREELFERTHGVPALVDRVARTVLERVGKGVVGDESLREALDVAGL